MKKIIDVEKKEPLVLMSNSIIYSQKPYWCGTINYLSMTFMAPRQFFPYDTDTNGKIWPVLVFLCGGGMRRMDRGAWMGELAWFAKKGYAIASVQYSTDKNTEFPVPAVEVKEAIRFLRANAKKLNIDPDRIAIMGESAGAYLAGFTGLTKGIKEYEEGDYLDEDSSVQSVVTWYVPNNSRKQPGRPTLDSLITKDSPPFLLIHGDADDCVNVEQSEILYSALEKNGIPSDLYIIKGANHGDGHFVQVEIKEIILEFLNKTLKVS